MTDKNEVVPVDLAQNMEVKDGSPKEEDHQSIENNIEPLKESDSQKPASKLIRYRFNFHGNGKEFFGIWIVNILLTIVTLGAYSAWAKVRQTRYLYGNLELAGSRFQYLAEPRTILRGRIIALLLVAPYIYFSYVNPTIAASIIALIALISPILIVLAYRFRLHNSSYRNIRFGFTASIAKAYLYYVILPVATVITFGLAAPAVMKAQRQFKMNNTGWGGNSFHTEASAGFFYLLMLKLFILMMAGGLFLYLGINTIGEALEGSSLQLFSFVPTMLFYVFMVHYFYAAVFQHMLERSEIAGAKFETFQVEPGKYAMIQATNLIAILLTAGLAYPWAKVRSMAYLAENISVLSTEGLEHTVKAEHIQSNAVSEEVANMYELDLGM